jgi:hypothetical protein
MPTHADQPELERALATAKGLKPGTWESVEALAVLALETGGTPEGIGLLEAAGRAAAQLRSGNWESVRALAWLARAQREVGAR